MKKTFLLQDLDCANCAAKIENGVKKIQGVQSCTVAFMTTKMVIEAEDVDMERVVKEAKAYIKKVESDVTVIEK